MPTDYPPGRRFHGLPARPSGYTQDVSTGLTVAVVIVVVLILLMVAVPVMRRARARRELQRERLGERVGGHRQEDIEAESSSAGEDVSREEAAARRHQEKAGEIEREL